MYLTYEEFIEMGGSIDAIAFNRLEAKARAQLDHITFCRLCEERTVRQAVKYCMFDLINAVHADESVESIAAGRAIASMSNDGVSINFSTGSASARAASARYWVIAKSWLINESDTHGIPLMYAGVSVR